MGKGSSTRMVHVRVGHRVMSGRVWSGQRRYRKAIRVFSRARVPTILRMALKIMPE